jgi:LytS/YehU family sensor histidine kinase
MQEDKGRIMPWHQWEIDREKHTALVSGLAVGFLVGFLCGVFAGPFWTLLMWAGAIAVFVLLAAMVVILVAGLLRTIRRKQP